MVPAYAPGSVERDLQSDAVRVHLQRCAVTSSGERAIAEGKRKRVSILTGRKRPYCSVLTAGEYVALSVTTHLDHAQLLWAQPFHGPRGSQNYVSIQFLKKSHTCLVHQTPYVMTDGAAVAKEAGNIAFKSGTIVSTTTKCAL